MRQAARFPECLPRKDAMPRRLLQFFVIVAVVVAGGAAVLVLWQPWRAPRLVADAGDATAVATGRAIYAARCAACHGEDLAGQAGWRAGQRAEHPPPPALDAGGFAWHNTDRGLFGIVKHGVAQRGMPAFADTLSDDEIWAVIAFLKSSWPLETRTLHERLNPS
jgi:mono/diheme cytochrome c family protein